MEESKALAKKEKQKEVFARLRRENLPEDREHIEGLPRWVKTALVMRAVDGMPWKQAAARAGHAPGTLKQYSKSPAAKKWLIHLNEWADDPIEMAKAYMRANALSITLDRIAFLEAAIAAGDYKAGDAIAKDIQEKLGIVSPKTKTDVAPVLNITIGSGSVEIPAIEATWTEVKDEEDD